jgi:hypothetical protein
MERDYAAIIAAMRVKAKKTEFPEERDALLAKAKELEEKYDLKGVPPVYESDPTDWIRVNYRMTGQYFYTKPEDKFLVVITGEDPKWRRSYLWPTDGSPIMNPYHPWEDTEE